MRTVRNTVDTGRTVVCTIHQPSIEIFEAFDELLLMKRGGRVIYGGKLGEKSNTMIDYFQRLPGIPPIPNGYNPATWMLEISTPAAEERIGQDFAVIYQNSQQYREVEASIVQSSVPPIGSEPLRFSSTFSQDTFSQFRTCFWKQNLVYWRSPQYSAVRLLFTTVSALLIGSIFWDIGSKRDTTTNLMTVMGALYTAALFLGVNNSSSVQPVVSIERTVFYRERAAGMYSSFPYAAAQGLVELPYLALQTMIYCIITYFMIPNTKGMFGVHDTYAPLMKSYAFNKASGENIPLEEVFENLKCNREGLASDEVQKRLDLFGYNKLEEKKESKLLKFLGFMWNPLSWVMEAAAIMSIALANGGGKGPDVYDFVGILLLLIINSTISFIEENNAGNAAAALMARLAPKAKVLRDGKWSEEDAAVLVPGDIISIKLGDIIPADARLLEGDPLKIDQSFD